MFGNEGQQADNEGAPFWDANALNGAGGWIFASSRGTPPKHDDSPAISKTEMALVVAEAFVGEQEWHSAMPLPLKTWMQTRPLAQQAHHREGCKQLKYLSDLL